MHNFNLMLYQLSVSHINSHFDQHIPSTFFQQIYDPEIDRIHPSVPRRRFFYTAIGYALSSQGARVLLDLVEQYGIRVSADLFLLKLLDLPNTQDTCYTLHPVLVDMPQNRLETQATIQESEISSDGLVIYGAPRVPPVVDASFKGSGLHQRIQAQRINHPKQK